MIEAIFLIDDGLIIPNSLYLRTNSIKMPGEVDEVFLSCTHVRLLNYGLNDATKESTSE